MKCANHPDNNAADVCRICGKSFCHNCLVEVSGNQYCRECLAQRIAPEADAANKNIIKGLDGDRKSRLLAFALSLIPGVGYFYLGLMNRGLQIMLLFFGSIFITSYTGLGELMGLVAPVAIFYSIFDTQQLVKQYNAGIALEDRQLMDMGRIRINQAWIGYVLIVIGILALMNNFNLWFPYWGFIRRMLPGLFIIAAGVYILYKNMPNKTGEPPQS